MNANNRKTAQTACSMVSEVLKFFLDWPKQISHNAPYSLHQTVIIPSQ